MVARRHKSVTECHWSQAGQSPCTVRAAAIEALHVCNDLTHMLWSPARPGHAAWALAPPSGVALMARSKEWSVLARARSSIASCCRSVEAMLGSASAVSYSLRVASRDEHRAMLCMSLRAPLDGLDASRSGCRPAPQPSAISTTRCTPSTGVGVVDVEPWAGHEGCLVHLPAAM